MVVLSGENGNARQTTEKPTDYGKTSQIGEANAVYLMRLRKDKEWPACAKKHAGQLFAECLLDGDLVPANGLIDHHVKILHP